MIPIYLFAASFLFSWLILYITIPILRKYFIVNPNIRSSHSLPTPSGGGISFVTVTIIISLFVNSYIPLMALPLSLIGFVDDRINLKSKFRFSAQILSFAFIIAMIFQSQDGVLLNSVFASRYSLLLSSFILLIGVSFINFLNFMDGIDGLVSGCMIVIFTTLSLTINNNLLILVGSLIGFLVWNWCPSKVFMGDVGSYFLGVVFSGILLTLSSWQEFLKVILLTSPLMMDALFCVMRRLFNGQNIFKPHKLHLYQRLHQAGLSHSKVSILYIFSTLLISIFYLYQNLLFQISSVMLIFFIGFYLDQNLAKPFSEKNI